MLISNWHVRWKWKDWPTLMSSDLKVLQLIDCGGIVGFRGQLILEQVALFIEQACLFVNLTISSLTVRNRPKSKTEQNNSDGSFRQISTRSFRECHRFQDSNRILRLKYGRICATWFTLYVHACMAPTYDQPFGIHFPGILSPKKTWWVIPIDLDEIFQKMPSFSGFEPHFVTEIANYGRTCATGLKFNEMTNPNF